MAQRKKIIVSVSNDLFTDQRVKKVCEFLHENEFEVVLLGRLLKKSNPINDRAYQTKRFKLWFNKGALFYANLNIRLFFYLLFHKADWLLANDLDTLPANYYASKFKRKCTLVYDTHEIFCEVPELQHSPRKKRIWQFFEKRIFPKLKKVYTVNTSIALYYKDLYKVEPMVVRNISKPHFTNTPRTRAELGLPENKFIIIIQGSGINIDRGNEEVLQAMQFLSDDFFLLVAGSGDCVPALKTFTREHQLEKKVTFLDRMDYALLMEYTRNSNVGISLDKSTNLNYQYSLPNKLFDFIHAGIPVLASNLKEIAAITTQYQTGLIIESHDPTHIAQKFTFLFEEKEFYQTLVRNCKEAAKELTWTNETLVLQKIYEVN